MGPLFLAGLIPNRTPRKGNVSGRRQGKYLDLIYLLLILFLHIRCVHPGGTGRGVRRRKIVRYFVLILFCETGTVDTPFPAGRLAAVCRRGAESALKPTISMCMS